MTSEPSVDLPALPHTWRARLGLVVAVVMAVVLVITGVGLWVALPPAARADFSPAQVVTLALLLVALLYGLYRLGRIRLEADEHGLTIVNLVRSRRLEWAQVLNVSLRPGDPWVQLDLDDGTTMPVMAIQSADGARARRAAQDLAALVAARTRTQRNT
ncbi:PH domain-containing protein [Thermasporomyces composti]|jgi:hypothetical protein|uniref:PH (Pleckstrin Homology) domain-containing protein n=1 Tax=Thermasporomyces composti TaxID=696763 RepID=A0A3D9V7F5_THECX|nr:PH domain-containing protein [Thermasporomyces composti]REF34965.1 PH (Pleckstrin Homology) domain-containing protein [Thermasporomyces composti]